MFVATLAALAAATVATPAATCDVTRAESILRSISTGKEFCSHLIYPHGVTTTTVTQTAATLTCVTKTKTVVMRTVITTTWLTRDESSDSIFVCLSQPTSTAYGSTVFNTVITDQKRVPQNTNPTSSFTSISTDSSWTTSTRTSTLGLPAVGELATHPNRPVNSAPTALSTCADKSISSACSFLVPKSTTIINAMVQLNGKPCSTEETITKYKSEGTTTVTSTITGTPAIAMFVTSPAATVTIAVPAQCLGPYYTGGSIDPNEFGAFFPKYPNFPIDSVHCCLDCFSTPNCVASFYNSDSLECERLVRLNNSLTMGPDALCSLGAGDFPFIDSGDTILRGPCA